MAIDGRDVHGAWGFPFVLLLVILSFVPQVFPNFWHRWWVWVSNLFLVSIVVGMFGHFKGDFASDFVRILMEYEGFMCLIFALFVTSSGILFTPALDLRGTPLHNTLLILVAGLFSNIMGSSGATLLFIRPLVASNKWRQNAGHSFVFFIWIVCNTGASLSPMGDPPLFIGYIKGVPFFWWLIHLAGPTFTCVGMLMLVYVPIEIYYFRKDPQASVHLKSLIGDGNPIGAGGVEASNLEMQAPQAQPSTSGGAVAVDISGDKSKTDTHKQQQGVDTENESAKVGVPLSARFPKFAAAKTKLDNWLDGFYNKHPALRFIDGWRNIPLLFAVPVITFLTGIWAKTSGHVFYFDNAEYLVSDLFRDLSFLLIGIVSYLITSERTRHLNEFSWDPIIEVIVLFSSIFATMLPCIIMLQAGTEGALSGFISGLTKDDGTPNNLAYYWVSGILSAFLDNTPEFIVLYDVALNAIPLSASFVANATANGQDIQSIRADLLENEFSSTLGGLAAGAVYFGGLTYIGNAPNFFVKNIAEAEKIKIPTFLGFMLWGVVVFIPVLAIVGAIFFNS